MTARWTTWLAISLWTLTMLLAGCALVLMFANGETDGGIRDGLRTIFVFAIIASPATVGALLVVHRPANPIGWIFLVAALSIDVSVLASGYGTYITETSPGALPPIMPLFWLGAWCYLVPFMIPPTFGIMLFPTGRLPSRRWRPALWFTACWITLTILSEMFSPGPLDPESDGSYLQFMNPVGIESMSGAIDLFLMVDDAIPLGLIPFILAVASIFARLRVASVVERQQIKWFAYAATIPIIGTLVEEVIFEVSSTTNDGDSTIGSYLALLGVALLPIAVGIAILRHNLYDIDRLINRTLVYGGATALLALGFVGSVVLFQFILAPFTSGNDLAIAGSTLLTAGLFRPMRDRIQRLVDRRFYRQKYDARKMLEDFSVTARDAVDLDQVTRELANVVDATLQPSSISIWLTPTNLQRRQ